MFALAVGEHKLRNISSTLVTSAVDDDVEVNSFR